MAETAFRAARGPIQTARRGVTLRRWPTDAPTVASHSMPEPSALLVVVAVLLVAVLVAWRARARRAPSADALGVPAYRPRTAEEERRELGIGEVRARKAVRNEAYASSELYASAEPFDEPLPPRPIRTASARPPTRTDAPAEALPDPVLVTSAPPRARRARRDEDLPPDELVRASQEHLLNALLLSAGAHTVCLLREDDGAHRRYHIERIVSRNAFARPSGHFVPGTALLPDTGKRRTTLHRVGHGHAFPPEALGYYRETLAGLREALVTPLVLAGVPHLLVADAMHAHRLDDRRAKTLVEATARLLEHGPAPALREPEGDGLPAPLDAPDADTDSTLRAFVTRALAEAGAAGLALALVYAEPHGAGTDGLTGEALDAAERALFDDLRAHLHAALPEAARLERCADLTAAVASSDTSEGFDGWVEATHARLAARYPDGRVALGAVVYDGLAPMSAEDLRGHALAALGASYEEGQPVVLG